MKVIELFEEENILGDLEKVMKLRATASKVSQENAEKCLKWLATNGYRWSFEQVRGAAFLHIVASSFKKGWQNLPGKSERAKVRVQLSSFGYATAPYRENAINQETNKYGGPQVYFW